ncbi:MAG: hypothetical protein V3T83_09555 [Acidobacteriota bacterium]
MIKTRLFRALTAALAVLAVTALPLLATRVRMLNLVEMVQLSDRIFWGVCLDAQSKDDPDTGLTMMEYTFQVQRGFKGVQAGERVVFRQFQAASGRIMGIPGLPRYNKGNEWLIFLHGDSRIGLTSPVGMEQGLFRLERMQDGEVGVVNSLGNANLAYNLQTEQIQSSGLARSDLDLLSKAPKPMPLEAFAALVDKIDRNLKTRALK